MKYQKQLAAITNGEYSRAKLRRLLANAEIKFKSGDNDAKIIMDAINVPTPSYTEILFMGFCPGRTIDNREDAMWREKGICTFDWEESEAQMERFQNVRVGDKIVLKKQNIKRQIMELSGHGKVTSVKRNEEGLKYLVMNWSDQERIIEVPLMGCSDTVNIKTMDVIEEQMPEEFFEWLGA